MRIATAPALTLVVASALGLMAEPACAQRLAQGIVTGGAGNTGIPAPSTTGGVEAGTVQPDVTARGGTPGPLPPAGNAAGGSNSSIPGTTPDVVIGGTATSGPPGTGGTAGGPSLGGGR